MSDKTNEEKLKILQERLAQIKQKKDIALSLKKQQEKDVLDSSSIKKNPEEISSKPFKWVKYSIASLCIAFGFFYAYNNLDLNLLKSTNSSQEIEKTASKEMAVEEDSIDYMLDFEGQKNIVITGAFDNEKAAKNMVNKLKEEGFQVDYFYLPNRSNSTKQVYEVFIGPYENDEETNQWIENLQTDYRIILL